MDERKEELQLRVALYLRVSTEDQVEKYGLDAQRSAIEGIIKSRGKLKDGRDAVVLAGKNYEYVDEGISGTKELDDRPAFARLKEDILNAPPRQKPFDVVAVFKIDRFARKLRILMDVLNFFEKKQIEFISATESIDTSTPFGRAMLGIMGVIAELELETIRERTQRGRAQAIQEGVVMGAHAPYGYRKDKEGRLEVFDEEAKIVRRIFRLFTIDKYSPQKIADILTKDEILTPDASAVKYLKRKGASRKLNEPNFWRAERVRDILADEVYIGRLYYDKSKHGKPQPKSLWKLSSYQHEPLVLRHIFGFAQDRLADLSARKAITRKKEQGNIYLLSGLLKCDQCRKMTTPTESDMMSWTGGRKFVNYTQKYTYHYACNRKNSKKFSFVCPVVPIPADPLENYVIEFVKQLISDPKAVYEHQKELASTQLSITHMEEDKKELESMLKRLPQRLQSLSEQHEMGVIDTPTLQRRKAELAESEKNLKAKIDELDFQLSQVALSQGYEASLKLYAEKYGKTLDKIIKDRRQLHDLIHDLIYQVVVYSRPRTEKDIIAGRKKQDQYIPDRIDIYLNLPQNLLQHLYTQKFGVKSDTL